MNKNPDISNLFPDLSLVAALENAHAHNDYEQSQPLIKALSYGFASIEVDVHLIKKQLYVSHYRPLFPNPKKTIQNLYLNPLFQLFQKSKNPFFFQNEVSLTLMIDLKSDNNKSYECLKQILKDYEPMLSYWENNVEHRGAIKILLSGNRPIKKVLSEKKRWVQIDGRIEDINKNYHPEFMPIISDKYSKILGRHFFTKKLSQKKLTKLKHLVTQVHAEGKKLRLWKSPERELIWSQMIQQGIDIINTDQLARLSHFFNHTNSSSNYYISE